MTAEKTLQPADSGKSQKSSNVPRSQTKKVLLFIVEGPTDEDSLAPVLKALFEDTTVRFHVVHGDLTADGTTHPGNPAEAVNRHIRREMSRYGFRRQDILQVIHLIDTDGAFIPPENVVTAETGRTSYCENQILCKNPRDIQARNERKRAIVTRLRTFNAVGRIPYRMYYLSRNLEHALHGVRSRLTDDQKEEYADLFANRFENDPEAFPVYLQTGGFAVPGSYDETWDYIFEGTRSLERWSNLHLLFQDGPV